MKNKNKAIKILSADCKIRHKYCWGGKTCAIGALALAVGYPRERLLTHNEKCISESRMRDLQELLEKKFGLSVEQLDQIQGLNDRQKRASTRRRKVVALVKTF